MIKVSVKITGPGHLKNELGRFAEGLMSDVLVTARSKTPIQTGNARRGWKKRGRGVDTVVENRVPYIKRLDEGYSRQAPNGIVRPTINEIAKRK